MGEGYIVYSVILGHMLLNSTWLGNLFLTHHMISRSRFPLYHIGSVQNQTICWLYTILLTSWSCYISCDIKQDISYSHLTFWCSTLRNAIVTKGLLYYCLINSFIFLTTHCFKNGSQKYIKKQSLMKYA